MPADRVPEKPVEVRAISESTGGKLRVGCLPPGTVCRVQSGKKSAPKTHGYVRIVHADVFRFRDYPKRPMGTKKRRNKRQRAAGKLLKRQRHCH